MERTCCCSFKSEETPFLSFLWDWAPNDLNGEDWVRLFSSSPDPPPNFTQKTAISKELSKKERKKHGEIRVYLPVWEAYWAMTKLPCCCGWWLWERICRRRWRAGGGGRKWKNSEKCRRRREKRKSKWWLQPPFEQLGGGGGWGWWLLSDISYPLVCKKIKKLKD